MKPFDLTKALAGEPVVTRDGQPVTQLTKFDCDSAYPLRAVIDGKIISFTIDGICLSKRQCSHDLFMAEPERWVNVYWDESKNKAVSFGVYNSRAIAELNVYSSNSQHYQTTIKLK
jgi:(p)ppGpp synthase/HD superfamily hydrolase